MSKTKIAKAPKFKNEMNGKNIFFPKYSQNFSFIFNTK